MLPVIAYEKYDSDSWQKHFEVIANRGGEGIVAKRDTSIYMVGKRNSDLLKLKLELTVDCLGVALEETVGDKGNSGLVLVSQRKSGVLVRTVIGKHVDQELFRKDKYNVIGKVVQVKAMEEYADGQLRQPVFQHVRHDKKASEIN
jgi:bifunctional non-homologous end joining protein LigD